MSLSGVALIAITASVSGADPASAPLLQALAGFEMTDEASTVNNPALMQVALSAPARDGNIAIREEFDAAIAVNTVAALELFIARHPDHELAQLAQQQLVDLTNGQPNIQD